MSDCQTSLTCAHVITSDVVSGSFSYSVRLVVIVIVDVFLLLLLN